MTDNPSTVVCKRVKAELTWAACKFRSISSLSGGNSWTVVVTVSSRNTASRTETIAYSGLELVGKAVAVGSAGTTVSVAVGVGVPAASPATVGKANKVCGGAGGDIWLGPSIGRGARSLTF